MTCSQCEQPAVARFTTFCRRCGFGEQSRCTEHADPCSCPNCQQPIDISEPVPL